MNRTRLLLLFTFFVKYSSAGLGGLGGLTVKDPECDEFLENPEYTGKRCTLRDISTKRTSYNWYKLTQTELVFIDCVVLYIPTDLQMEMGTFEMINLTSVNLQYVDKGNFELGEKLTQVILRRNQIYEVSKNTFIGTPNLKLLDLSENEIERIHPTGFKNLRKLLHLDLQKNFIPNIDFEIFNEMSELKHLNLGYNDFTSLDVTDLRVHLPNLEWIGLKGAKIDCTEIKIIGQKLKEIEVMTDVIDNETGEILPDAGCVMPEMSEIWFD